MVKFIADIGSNHNGSLERALELIQEAKLVGCSAVKFQLFNGELLGKPKREWLPLEWLPELRDEVHNLGLEFGCSPFYLKAVEELEPYVDFYKIAASQVDNFLLIKACLKVKKQMMVSIPYGWKGNIHDLNRSIVGRKGVLTLLHCMPRYPTEIKDANLYLIEVMAAECKYFGYSDHTGSPAVIYRAVHHYDLDVIEFHLDLDCQGWEYHYGHCWLPSEISEVIQTVKEGFEAD